MSRSRGEWAMQRWLLAAGVLATACSEPAPRVGASRLSSAAASVDGCAAFGLRPSSVPPAEGVWSSAGSSNDTRIAAMIGPAEIRSGSTRVTRTIETVETSPGRSAERHRLDTASVRVELLPPHRDGGRSGWESASARVVESAAVYPIDSLVSVASYEACSGLAPSAIRYLRRDARGRLIADAMLRREPTNP